MNAQNLDDVNSPAKWELDYRRGTARWSLGTPTPVFQALLAENIFPPGRMLVPGAGLGYDAREFARHRFEVVAVDFAQDAVDAMRGALTPETRHAILQDDFFQLPTALRDTFDYVLECCCYCAIDPTRRAEYADQIARMLKRGGAYIALAFPLGEHVGGPPFAVKPEELIALLQARGFTLLRRQVHPATIKPRQGREELLVLRKT